MFTPHPLTPGLELEEGHRGNVICLMPCLTKDLWFDFAQVPLNFSMSLVALALLWPNSSPTPYITFYFLYRFIKMIQNHWNCGRLVCKMHEFCLLCCCESVLFTLNFDKVNSRIFQLAVQYTSSNCDEKSINGMCWSIFRPFTIDS